MSSTHEQTTLKVSGFVSGIISIIYAIIILIIAFVLNKDIKLLITGIILLFLGIVFVSLVYFNLDDYDSNLMNIGLIISIIGIFMGVLVFIFRQSLSRILTPLIILTLIINITGIILISINANKLWYHILYGHCFKLFNSPKQVKEKK